MKTNLTKQETVLGWIYLIFQLLLLPSILYSLNSLLRLNFSKAELNFVFFLTNFLAVLWIFHGFLSRCAQQVKQHPAYFIQAVVLGTAAYYACSHAVEQVIALLVPGFANANDASLVTQFSGNSFLLTLGTVVLVPPVEECLYRGLFFRRLYSRSPALSYVVSILGFAAIHILGFLDTYSPLELCMAVLQYVPAGLCLAWAYTKADTIFAPIAIHAIVNAVSIGSLR